MTRRDASLWLLIDGYNVVAPVAAPGRSRDPRWLQHERMRLIRRLTERLDPELRSRTCVVFDAANPPPDRPNRFEVESIDVRFAVGYPEADDLLEELIDAHTAPKRLAVVSSDHRIQAAAARRGCQGFDSEPWLDRLLEGDVALAFPRGRAGQGDGSDMPESEKPSEVSRDDAQQWMEDFGFE